MYVCVQSVTELYVHLSNLKYFRKEWITIPYSLILQKFSFLFRCSHSNYIVHYTCQDRFSMRNVRWYSRILNNKLVRIDEMSEVLIFHFLNIQNLTDVSCVVVWHFCKLLQRKMQFRRILEMLKRLKYIFLATLKRYSCLLKTIMKLDWCNMLRESRTFLWLYTNVLFVRYRHSNFIISILFISNISSFFFQW